MDRYAPDLDDFEDEDAASVGPTALPAPPPLPMLGFAIAPAVAPEDLGDRPTMPVRDGRMTSAPASARPRRSALWHGLGAEAS